MTNASTDPCQRFVAEYFRTGTLAGLPTGHLIGGAWVEGTNRGRMDTVDPGAGRAFGSVPSGRAADVDRAVVSARSGFETWRRTRPAERGRILARAAGLIRERADYLAVVEALDSGKTLAEAKGDVGSAARCFEYYAGAADKIHGDSIPLGPGYLALTVQEPVGVVAQIIPWNYPLSTFARGVAPALAAGCAVVAKPADTTPLTALLLGRLLRDAGLPEGACNVVTGTGREAGAALAAHPGVDHVTFTGSPATGTAVMQAAAAHFASVTLELGGKSPLIALADCDLDAAAAGAVSAIYENAGQICSAGSRLVVERKVHESLVARIAAKAAAIKVGHGLKGNDMGAINSERQLCRIMAFVEDAKNRGRRIAAGGCRLDETASGGGWFVAPTIIDDLPPDDPCVQEEIFGPVLAVQVVDSADEALAAANGTSYGLMSGVYTRDIAKALALSAGLRSGQVTINEYWAGGVEIPFGGVGRSGFGREKGLEALSAYCRVKSIVARI